MDLSGRWSSKEVAISISNVVDDFTITTTRQGSFYALRFPFIREYSCPYDATHERPIMKRTYAFALVMALALVFAASAFGDTIFLKSGEIMISPKVWEEDGMIKCEQSGGVVGFPPNRLDRVEKDEGTPIAIADNGDNVGTGWVITEASARGGKPFVTYVQNNQVRLEPEGDPNGDRIILHVATGELTYVSMEKKQYWKGPIRNLSDVVVKIFHDSQQRLADELASLPEDQREAVRQSAYHYMGGYARDAGRPAPLVAIKKSGQEKVFAGLAAEGIDVSFDGVDEWRIWIAKDAFPGSALNLRQYADVMKNYQEGISFLYFSIGKLPVEVMELYGQGWPLAWQDSKKWKYFKKVVKIERKVIPEAEFAAPEGFTYFDMPAEFLGYIQQACGAGN
ncbi:MAG: hypothetical protein HZB23_06450 [Deltaproteobacteria bacterium]|nr:hypothetical protein [Deltaproteobacteria bacterium]